MTFREFAFKNVFRNMRLYVAYFLSSLFTVIVFFTFLNFAFHPALHGEQMNDNVLFGMSVAGGIIYVFSFFFILYSMNSFLQSRKKEFGLYLIQGMSHKQLRLLIFLENMIIGVLTTLLGMIFGVLFSKLILLVAENVLKLQQLPFYFPTSAILVTLVSFVTLFFFISLFVTFVLRTNTLISLIKGEEKGKGEPKASIFLTIIAIVLLGLGYFIALIVEQVAVVFALLPVSILVIVGTFFLFTQLNVYVVKKLKHSKHLFWRKTNMLLFSDLSFRMKDNARAFFMVAIISTVSFSAIGTLVGFDSYLTTGIKEAHPISFSLTVDEAEDERETIYKMEQILDKYDITYEKGQIMLAHFDFASVTTLVTTPEQYNTFARLVGEKEISLKGEEVAYVPTSKRNIVEELDKLKFTPIILKDGTYLYADEKFDGLTKPDVLPSIQGYFIVSDELFEQLDEPVFVERHTAWQVVDGDYDKIVKAGEEAFQLDERIFPVEFTIEDIRSFWNPVLFVGFFIGVVFFVSAGSFLYFRLYTDIEDDRKKFSVVRKLGVTNREIKKVISRQMFLLFFVPIIVAIFHGAVALTALSNLFQYSLVKEATIVLGGFFLIQIIYFIVVRYFYTRHILRSISIK